MPPQTGLTPEQVALLEMPFAANEHAFADGKGLYIRKSAIRRRLNSVDPGWSMTEPVLVDKNDHVVVLSASLTIGGVTRPGVGVGIIGTQADGYKRAIELSKAFKSAAVDCLPRAADAFGVGSYLRDLNKEDKRNIAALQRWLDSQNAAAPGGPAPRAASNGTPPARGGKLAWHDNPDALPALERRFKTYIAPDLTLDEAARLVKQPVTAYRSSEDAFNAVQQAHIDAVLSDPA